MNFAGSERAGNNKSFDCRNMGDVLGKECVKEEPSFTHSSQNSLREASASNSCAVLENESEKELPHDSDEDISWLLSFDADDLTVKKCKCDGCLRRNYSFDSEKKNAKLLLAKWKELQSYIRNVYINSPLELEAAHVKEIDRLPEMVQVMRLCDPYQLFQKIEDEVRAMIIKSRVRQLNMIKEQSNPDLAAKFITSLLEEYLKLLSSAFQLSPTIELLLGPQLNRFGITWEMLNKHLYQSLMYSHNDIKENLFRFIEQARTKFSVKDDLYHKLVHRYLVFDEEMASVETTWESIEPRIQEYRNMKIKENETLKIIQDTLKSFFAYKPNAVNGNGPASVNPNSEDDLECCPDCMTRKGCPCDECIVTHIIACEGYDSPLIPDSPISRSRSPVKEKEVIENKREMEEQQSCECHACTVPPPGLMDCSVAFSQFARKIHEGNFHIYPHIHGTIPENQKEVENVSNIYNRLQSPRDNVYPHLYNLPTQANSVGNVSEINIAGTNSNRTQVTQPVNSSKIQTQSTMTTRPQQKPPLRTQLAKTTAVTTHSSLPNCPPLPPPSPQVPPVSKEAAVSTKNFQNEKPKNIIPDKALNVNKSVPQRQVPVSVSSNSESCKPSDIKTEAKKSTVGNKVITSKENVSIQKDVLEKPKILPNTKASGCVISKVCGKCCLKHGSNCLKTPSCGKNSDKHLAAIARLGLANSSNPRGALRCPPGKENELSLKSIRGHSCSKLKPHDIIKKTPNGTGEINGLEPDDSSSLEDSCSERSNSTSASYQKDSRHCDCCYCEVFGHGMPSVAPVSRNYQEMRERLRLRLNMKKSANCKTGQTNTTLQPGQKAVPGPSNSQNNAAAPNNAKKNIAKEEDLESLLKFIEGKKREECKDPKRIAKRARQKQKKLEEKERMLEEEANRKRLESMKQQVTISVVNENKKTQGAKQISQQPNKNNKNSNNCNKTNSSHNNQHSNCNSNNNNSQTQNNQTLNLSGLKSLVEKSDPNSGPKMVTIRRVMAPFSAEPTVTITLKGSTPDKDKVLFMLKNGSETYQPEEKEISKKKRKRKKSKKNVEYYEEEDPESYYEEETEPVAEKPRKKRKRRKNKNKESESNLKSSLTNNQNKSKLTTSENINNKSSKTKNSKINSNVTNPKSAKVNVQNQTTNKKKSSDNSISSKSTQSAPSNHATNPKEKPQKNVSTSRAQQENLKNREISNKTKKSVSQSINNSNKSNVSKANNLLRTAIQNSVNKLNIVNKNSKTVSKSKTEQNQSVTVNRINQKCQCAPVQRNQNAKNKTANTNTVVSNVKQSASKKNEINSQLVRQSQMSQGKGKTSDIRTKLVQKPVKNNCETSQKGQQRQETKQKVMEKKQEPPKKSKCNQKTVMGTHDMNSRIQIGDRYDRGKVVINTPSYRLSEVLSSIAPSPPPKEEINLENLRLPPGITITKIEGPVTKSIRASEQPLHVSKPVPITPPIVVSTPTLKQSHPPPPPGNVIVVDTGRLKEVIKENPPNPASQSTTTSKKKKKKNKQNAENRIPTVEVPMTQPPKYNVKMPKNNPIMGKSGVTLLSTDNARKMVPNMENQQATIIKTSDNMVTIRSPAFQQAMNMHAYQNSPNYRPGINGYNNVSLFRNDVSKMTDNFKKVKLSSEDKLVRQMRNLNIKEGSRASQIFAQAMAVAEQSNQENQKKKKKKRKQGSHRSDDKEVEPVESVFQPKDIDLENGDIDDDERELEAFKRFCLQSVPSERKNKVKVNLNIKDIVLKKKSSAIGCS